MKYKIFAIALLASALGLAGCSSAAKSDSSKDAAKAAAAAPAAKDSKAAKTDAKASAKTAASSTGADVSCQYGEVKRELKIVQSADRCVVEYTKDGTTQEIGSGTANSPFCQEVVDRVKNNLAAAGYKCN